ncbi:HpcH/HpaI aldolase family protein [Jiangella endophytica]|uniref:HpcH/HpaI aldolase family protein n=1 Tax=Jiangella endophytica TaxID=1623398 RepID=UPI000E3470C0|nr:aldolase/citrate lyase family protein [Jiangella endophytica]
MPDRSPPPLRLGTMICEFAGPAIPRLLASAGLGFAVVDGEHGAFDDGQVTALIAAAHDALDIYVRVPLSERARVGRYLDAGATGIVAPMISTRSDCERLVEATKYPPLGRRGVSTFRAHTDFQRVDVAEYLGRANARVRALAQIETVAALDRLDAIASVPGLDGLVLGPNDLLTDAGAPGHFGHPVLDEALRAIGVAARSHQLTTGVITSNAALASRALALGCTWLSWSSESALLHRAAADARDAFLEADR